MLEQSCRRHSVAPGGHELIGRNVLAPLTWQYLRTRKFEVFTVAILQLAATLASLELPGLNARIIDEGVALADTAVIWRLGLIMVGLTCAQGIATGIAVFLGAQIAMGLGAWLRHRVFTHVQAFSIEDIHDFGASSLITRTTNDVQQIQTVVVMAFATMVQAPIMGVGALIQAFRQDVNLSLLLVVMVPTLTVVVAIIMKLLSPLFAQQQKRLDAMNTVLREELTGVRVIRAFVRQPFIAGRYQDANDALRAVAMRIGGLFAVMFPLLMLVISLTNVGVVWYGGHLIDAGTAQVGSLFAFLNYVGMLLGAVMMAAMIVIMVPRADIAAGRIHEVLVRQPKIAAPAKPTSVPDRERWTFAFDNVCMQYPGAETPVVENVSLTLEPGTTTALIGATGSGKTTLVNLLPRLIDPSCGEVTANGVPLTDIDLDLLRTKLAVVPQRAHLFSGTIASTISGVDNPDDAQRARIDWAIQGACADEFVGRLSDGIDAKVEPGGKNFSGGQRQRLSIARALYRQADLYVFDDASSALDHGTDAQLRANLPKYTGGAAVLLVAQRVASVKDADTIIVLDGGRIVGRGSHDELLKSCETYQEIVASQNGQEANK